MDGISRRIFRSVRYWCRDISGMKGIFFKIEQNERRTSDSLYPWSLYPVFCFSHTILCAAVFSSYVYMVSRYIILSMIMYGLKWKIKMIASEAYRYKEIFVFTVFEKGPMTIIYHFSARKGKSIRELLIPMWIKKKTE
jgi:hypothetical protein